MRVGEARGSAHAHTSPGLRPQATLTSSSREEGPDPGCPEAWTGSRKTKLQPTLEESAASRRRGSAVPLLGADKGSVRTRWTAAPAPRA